MIAELKYVDELNEMVKPTALSDVPLCKANGSANNLSEIYYL